MSSMPEGSVAEVTRLIDEIRRLLAGRPALVQGAVLADLLAIWLAGHIVAASATETDRMREELLAAHIETVRALIQVNATDIHGKTP